MGEKKLHYKMYKDGKKFVFAAIATMSFFVFGGVSTVAVHADTTSGNLTAATVKSTSDKKSATQPAATAASSSSAPKADSTSASSSSATKPDSTSESSSSATKPDSTNATSTNEYSADNTNSSNDQTSQKPVTNTEAQQKDNNNQDGIRHGIRPSSITVNLLANGKKIASKTVTASDNWQYSWDNLPAYAHGKKIIYTVTENPVAGYTSTVDGYNLTNTLNTLLKPKTPKPQVPNCPTTPAKPVNPSQPTTPAKPVNPSRPTTPAKPVQAGQAAATNFVDQRLPQTGKNKKQANENELPQTGSNRSDSQKISIGGILLVAASCLFGAFGIRKRHNE